MNILKGSVILGWFFCVAKWFWWCIFPSTYFTLFYSILSLYALNALNLFGKIYFVRFRYFQCFSTIQNAFKDFVILWVCYSADNRFVLQHLTFYEFCADLMTNIWPYLESFAFLQNHHLNIFMLVLCHLFKIHPVKYSHSQIQ